MRTGNRAEQRRGGALIEFTLCLPVFLVIAFGTIETCRMLYLRQSLKIAAYESARIGIVPGADAAVVEAQCDLMLKGRKISGYEFSCEPGDPGTLEYGDIFTATVSLNAESYAIMGAWLYRGKVVTQSVSIMAEY